MTPPLTLSSTECHKYSAVMRRGVAPTAMRRPISRVCSEILASMAFMMPIPPTSNDNPAMEPITSANRLWVSRAFFSSETGATSW